MVANLHVVISIGCIPFNKIKKQAAFLCSTSLLYKILPANLVACKQAFNTFKRRGVNFLLMHSCTQGSGTTVHLNLVFVLVFVSF